MIYTIGHSTRSLPAFLALLNAHQISQLADVRTVPKSRRHPHFAGDALSHSLPAHGIAYRHFPGLGGLRKPRANSKNSAWRVEGFRGYADYMETPEFDQALHELLDWASGFARPSQGRDRGTERPALRRTAVMCAEAVWWRCHRQLIADALVARDIEVRHITSTTSAPAHTLTEFARLTQKRVSYPGLDSMSG
jgi:uncharacterized protein (DUF488 family)